MPLVIFLLALAARAGFGLYAFPTGGADTLQYDDERWYWSMAESYRRGEGLVGEFGHRAERMPLYPWFLSLFAKTEQGPATARWAQWALGALAASPSPMPNLVHGANGVVGGMVAAGGCRATRGNSTVHT